MKKTRENLLEKLLQQKRHPIRPKLISALLSICLLLASLPAELYGFQVQAKGQEYKILSFSELPEEVRSQNVEPGTPLEKLNLPKTLEAVCVPLQYEKQESGENQEQPGQMELNSGGKGTDLERPGEMEDLLSDTKKSQEEEGDNLPPVTETNQEEGEEIPPFDAEPEPEEEMETPAPDGEPEPEPGEEMETPAPDGEPEPEPEDSVQTPAPDTEGDSAEQPPQEPGETPQEQPETGSAAEETVVIEHIVWNSVFAYDGEKEGTYVFVPVLPEGYVLEKGVSLPEIQVAVEGEEGSKEEKEAAKEGKRGSRKAAEELEEEYVSRDKELALADAASEVISEDTVWDEKKRYLAGRL